MSSITIVTEVEIDLSDIETEDLLLELKDRSIEGYQRRELNYVIDILKKNDCPPHILDTVNEWIQLNNRIITNKDLDRWLSGEPIKL